MNLNDYELFECLSEYCIIKKNNLIDNQIIVNIEDIEFEYGDVNIDYSGCLYHGSMIVLEHYYEDEDEYGMECWSYQYRKRKE